MSSRTDEVLIRGGAFDGTLQQFEAKQGSTRSNLSNRALAMVSHASAILQRDFTDVLWNNSGRRAKRCPA
jgi:hypothetical protein